MEGLMESKLRELVAKWRAKADLRIPSLWRFVKCTKHEDYHSGCALCEEEVLSSKLEKAYIAGRLAGLEEAAKDLSPRAK